ncbi:acetyltransferase [Sulfurospirillum sp. T05]|uniref:Acetyltransferase n=1 Tax=Sulfurospirillum tamanense TaxID=2813362 RepID=A0ABS2WT96_9BACT|nr:acetyltransferase [Sulfurospirillum tamanensis]MBN2964813.1 acetyltransferase [Sulfurospirillum tamanensis]
MKVIYIYGSSGHGLVLADIAQACGYEEIVYIDGTDSDHSGLDAISSDQKIPVALGVASNHTRKALFTKLVAQGFEIATLIHPTAVISPSATLGQGTVVMPNVVVNAKARIGDGVILNSGAIVEHESSVGDFTHISPNVSIARKVIVEDLVHVGIGSCVIQNIHIGRESAIGAGSVVISNIDPNTVAFGVPCKMQKPKSL